ncbi:hypothetical protein [Radicibacter daui]|uniref:hypothetical protein n=1 Tax=Radicibacter daui TaxID=3064829 RepID=UPI004046C084
MRALREYLQTYFRIENKAAAMRRLILVTLAGMLLLPGSGTASERVVLKIYAAGTDTPTHSFTLSELKALPPTSLETDLPEALQIRGHHVWTGVPLGALTPLLGPGVSEIRLTALNDYSITIPVSDITTYQPILAYSRDGQDIAIRDKGPLIVIYPFGRYPELEQQIYLNRTIWQVGEIRAN